jgi:hypothetical protein
LATAVTTNYTFTDSLSGQSVTIAVTMTPYSSVTNNPAFTLLDTYDYNGSAVHLGIDSGIGGGGPSAGFLRRRRTHSYRVRKVYTHWTQTRRH